MDNTTLDGKTLDTIEDATAAIGGSMEAQEDAIKRLTVDLEEMTHRAKRWKERYEERHHETKAITKAMVPLIQAAFYEMDPSDVIALLPLGDIVSEVAEKMQSTHGFLDSIAEDVCHNYLDTDQLAEDVLEKLDQADIVSEVKSEAVQEVANVLADALRSIG